MYYDNDWLGDAVFSTLRIVLIVGVIVVGFFVFLAVTMFPGCEPGYQYLTVQPKEIVVVTGEGNTRTAYLPAENVCVKVPE